MWRKALEWLGYQLILGGLLVIVATAGLVLLREAAPSRASQMVCTILYAIAAGAVYGGFRLLRTLGAWSPNEDQ